MVLLKPQPPNGDRSFAFPLQCFMLKFNGAWPLKHDTPHRANDVLYLTWAYAMIVLIALTCYAQAAYLFASWGDVLVFTECGCTVFMGIHNLLRLIHLSYERRALKHLIVKFTKDIWISKSTHTEISLQCTREMVILRYVSLLQFVLILLYIVLPLLALSGLAEGDEKPFPYNMLFPYDATNGLAYSLTYFLTSLAGFGVVTNLFSEDSLFAFFTTHTCGRFRLLHKRILNVIHDGQECALKRYPNLMGAELKAVRSQIIQREYREQFIRIVHDHNILISFFEDLHKFFSPILLINYIISSLLICMVGLQIVAVKLTIADQFKLVVYIVSALSQLFIICWKGNDIIVHSEETANLMYSCDWQGKSSDVKNYGGGCRDHVVAKPKPVRFDFPCDVEAMRIIKFIIKRSQKPLILMAMKFSSLSLNTFSRILSTSLSYFTLLQSLLDRDE